MVTLRLLAAGRFVLRCWCFLRLALLTLPPLPRLCFCLPWRSMSCPPLLCAHTTCCPKQGPFTPLCVLVVLCWAAGAEHPLATAFCFVVSQLLPTKLSPHPFFFPFSFSIFQLSPCCCLPLVCLPVVCVYCVPLTPSLPAGIYVLCCDPGPLFSQGGTHKRARKNSSWLPFPRCVAGSCSGLLCVCVVHAPSPPPSKFFFGW